jgi:hypothetical protein
MRRLWPLALALGCGACVPVGETVLAPQSIAKGQRTILLVYPAPAPWVVTDSPSKAAAAAMALPIFSFAVSSLQEDRGKTASDAFDKYIPHWPSRGALGALETALLKELPKTGFPGSLVPVAEADPDTSTLRAWNSSSDVLDWQHKYLSPDPSLPHPRDYASFLPWDDALAMEVNLQPTVAADDDGNMVPTLIASTRLFRCQTMHQLWQHDDTVAVSSGSRSLYEFETLPQQLLDRWQELMPALASKISGSLNIALHPELAASSGTAVSSGTAPGGLGPAVSTGTGAFTLPQAAAPAPPAVFSPPAAAPAVSTPTAPSPVLPEVSSGTAVVPATPAISSPTVAAPAGNGPPAPNPPQR